MRILAVASAGGHWVQLLRLRPAFEGNDVFYASTKPGFQTMVETDNYIQIAEGSRWNKLLLVKSFFNAIKTIRSTKPDIIISTGAAPGLLFIIAGALLRKRTIWVDSIANVESISLSGRIAYYFTSRIYTQWEELSGKKIQYAGNVLS